MAAALVAVALLAAGGIDPTTRDRANERPGAAMKLTHTIDPDALRAVTPSLSKRRARKLAKRLGTALHKLEPGIGEWAVAYFIGQCAHESGEWRFTREIWGPSATQAGYWLRRALQGPGKLWRKLGFIARGGGWIQTTGREHFRTAARRLGWASWRALADAAGTDWVASLLAAEWWSRHFPNDMSGNAWNVDRVTLIVNGGTNGLEERRKYTSRAIRVRHRLKPKPLKP
jgi:putative chitinase